MDTGFPYVTFFATFFLTFNTVVAVIQAHHDISVVAFIFSIYVSVILLFWCIYSYDRLPEGSERRERLKIPVWTLLMVLQVVSAYRVSIILPLVWDLLVWILAGFFSLISYYFFIYPISATDKNENGENQYSSIEEEV